MSRIKVGGVLSCALLAGLLAIAPVAFGIAFSNRVQHAQPETQDAADSRKPDLTAAQAVQIPATADYHQDHTGQKPEQVQTQIPDQSVGDTKKPVRDWVDKTGLGINFTLALVGIGGVILALRTLNKVERQTAATETAARAAEVSAETSRTAERAWMLDSIVPMTKLPFYEEQFLEVRLAVKNKGRIVGTVTELNIVVAILPVTEEFMLGLPDAPSFDFQLHLELGSDGLALAPQQRQVFSQKLDLFQYGLSQYQSVNQADPVIAWLVVYGRIVYHDGFTAGRETHFSYFWHPNFTPWRKLAGYRRIGPAGYISAT